MIVKIEYNTTPSSSNRLDCIARCSLFTLLAFTLLLPPSLVLAVMDEPATGSKQAGSVGDQALLVNQSNRFLVLPPGRAVTVWFEFENTGTTTWTKDDPAPVGLNTDDPLQRTSMFQTSRWRATWRPTRLLQKTVAPGETGTFRFALKAPKKAGIWRERFTLVRGTKKKISGGEAEFVVVVGTEGSPSIVYRAKPKTPDLTLWLKPGERVLKPIEFRNVGYATWKTQGFGTTSIVHLQRDIATATTASALTVNATPAVTREAGRAKTTSAVLDFTAPTTDGTYEETFALSGPYGVIGGSQVAVTMVISSDAPPPLSAEPRVRVGIFAPTKPVEIVTDGNYEIRSADTNELLVSEYPDNPTTVAYVPATGKYEISSPSITTPVSTTAPVRFVPLADGTIFEVKSFSNRREVTIDGVKTTVNDNKFRDTIELRYSPTTKKLWVINELPLEMYLRGLAETSNAYHPEFTKALVTAARTYALFHASYATKHKNESYHINSTTDQLYRGYNYELRTPNISAAVEATRGMIVSHTSEIAEPNKAGAIVAAYSSCTDGRTRSYEERWGGTPGKYPYLVSVPDPNGICTNPRWLKGLDGNHMVGMSAKGALTTSLNDGITYDTLLKYYYTGTSVIKAYL